MFEDQKETMAAYELGWEKHAEKFARNMEKYAMNDVEIFSKHLAGNKVLDVGCGPGVYLEWFRDKGLDGMGIDLSDNFIRACIEKGLNVRKMDLEHPILWPNQFDGVFAQASLIHVPKNRFEKALNGLVRLLKPNGIFWLIVKEGEGERFVDDPFSPGKKR
jgi:SAM-dependent methyltransferase